VVNFSLLGSGLSLVKFPFLQQEEGRDMSGIRLLPFLLPGVLGFSGSASADCSSQLLSGTDHDGSRYVLSVPEDKLMTAPRWSPASPSEPPLSIKDALAIAMKWGKSKYVRYDSVRIDSITLRPTYGCSHSYDYWLYVVDFRPMIEGNTLSGMGNWAAILMNGEVYATQKISK
jgi:hypothetical protein